jgi:hypothetical protein
MIFCESSWPTAGWSRPRARGRPRHTTRKEPTQRVIAGALRAGRRALNLYLDASALVKRYVAEPESYVIRDLMGDADGWFMCRADYVETVRAVGLAAGKTAAKTVSDEWLT